MEHAINKGEIRRGKHERLCVEVELYILSGRCATGAEQLETAESHAPSRPQIPSAAVPHTARHD